MYYEDNNCINHNDKPRSVEELTQIIRNCINGDPILQDVWVLGEVSNLSKPISGHVYFTLKDQDASIKCVIWRTYVNRDIAVLENGMLIETHGRVDVYPVGGTYQLYIDKIRMQGSGSLFSEFIRLKQKLEKEGLFDSERKKQLPVHPRKIGLITSASGAAIKDVFSILKKRYPLAEVYLYPSAVQGIEAVNEIIAGINHFNHNIKPDVILLVRGGGDFEDLYPFNTEEVARAISQSTIPIITGIGHETDYTLADFAADRRAPTPTGAAIAVCPDVSNLREDLLEIKKHIYLIMTEMLNKEKERISYLRNLLRRTTPKNKILQQWQALDGIREKLNYKINNILSIRIMTIKQTEEKLDLINPRRIMERGYSIVKKGDGKIIRQSNQVEYNEKISIQLYEGKLGVEVKEIY